MSKMRIVALIVTFFVLPFMGMVALGMQSDGTGTGDRAGPKPVTSPEPLTMFAIVGGAMAVGGVVYRVRRRTQ